MNTNSGILLVNLGTPESPTVPAVKKFLSEFLHDRRVVDMTRWLWCPLLHGIILPIRSPKVAKLYQHVWLDEGSPLMVHSLAQVSKLHALTGLPVALGMTYGMPSIASGIETLLAQGVDRIVILPLYPQYSGTTTEAVKDVLAKVKQRPEIASIALNLIEDYHAHPSYIAALANKVTAYWQQHGRGDYLLCSYHGIPQRYADNGDVYPQHCETTTKLLAQALGLNEDQIGMSYQSRFGREAWLQPYTDKVLEQMGDIKSLDIISPAFSCDCLETLEEIAIGCRETFMEAGGEQFNYIPCLNDDDEHIAMMAELVSQADRYATNNNQKEFE
jgi:ferrochelatase